MKQIYFYLKDFVKKDFNWFTYGFTFVFLLICFSINYGLDFEDDILGKSFGKPIGLLYFTLYYIFPYFTVLIAILVYYKKKEVLSDYKFWVKSLVFVSLIGIAGGFYFYDDILSLFKDGYEQFYIRKILINSKRSVIYLIPLFIIKAIFDRKTRGLYGLHFGKFDVKPYFFMLLVVTPLVIWASFQGDFIKTYPKCRPWVGSEIFGLGVVVRTAIFEFIYGLDFVFVELIFRGALVIGMVSLLGKDAILPMVATYAFLHFGKPMAEAISSIFGGYILGIIAMNTRSILGGCIIHMGVAYLMELTANGQYYIFGRH